MSPQVNFQSRNKSQNNLDRVVQVVKSCQQVVSNLNEFMVTEFRTLFTNKCINLTVRVIPLVREFNQLCQGLCRQCQPKDMGMSWSHRLQHPKEVKIWARQFRVPVAQAPLDINHLQPTTNGSQGAVSQPAGLIPPQQAQVQPQAGCFLLQQNKLTDNYTKRW